MKLLRSSQWGWLVLGILGWPHAEAEVRIPAFYGHHMVLQREQPLRLRGWADPGEAVAVRLGDDVAEATTGIDGQWTVTLPARPASSTPLQLTFTGQNEIVLTDILIGEVWLCSGQSNMEWSVQASADAAAEIAAADYPLIRHMKAPRSPQTMPQDDVQSTWQVCSPETAGGFTAVGYYMARTLHKELDVPIGLVNSSWGGTRVEPWTPPGGFEQVPALRDIAESVQQKTPGTPAWKALLQGHLDSTKAWMADAETALADSSEVAPAPDYPAGLRPFQSHQDPTMLYNGMIHALVGFPIRGAIWYQGESNHTEGMLYYEKKKALISGWRDLWGQGDFPFYFVQIAPFQYGNEDPTILARFWEAQAAVTELPHTAMVVINDIATLNNIHPPNKQDVGARLAGLALKYDYGQSDRIAESPTFTTVIPQGKALAVSFRGTGGGLKTRDGKAPSHFEVTGAEAGGFHPANAVIEGDRVILTSDAVARPTAFRFAWNKLAEPNLCGGTGLPVGACRGGEIPDLLSWVPGSGNMELVYDLNLNTLNKEITYSVDRSDEIGNFGRVGYLLELGDSADEVQQGVFVAMDAFTTDAALIGVPSLSTGAKFQMPVTNLEVYATGIDLKPVPSGATGHIEFWSSNYGQRNVARVPGASDRSYDFGDDPSGQPDGYGCMQVHHPSAGETIFAVNHWVQGSNADIGIGNNGGDNPDWTFSGSASAWNWKRLRVFAVRN